MYERLKPYIAGFISSVLYLKNRQRSLILSGEFGFRLDVSLDSASTCEINILCPETKNPTISVSLQPVLPYGAESTVLSPADETSIVVISVCNHTVETGEYRRLYGLYTAIDVLKYCFINTGTYFPNRSINKMIRVYSQSSRQTLELVPRWPSIAQFAVCIIHNLHF